MVPFAVDTDIGAALPGVITHLRAGHVIAYPTETVYGLGTTLDAHALERVAALKERVPDQPFVVLIAGLDMLAPLGLTLASHAARLAVRHWPGPLTLILASARDVHPLVRGPRGQMAVRWTSHAGAQRIVRALGAPITSTSANRTGLPTARTPEEIVMEWSEAVATRDLLVLNGGAAVHAEPSSIVDCSLEHPRLVREGAIRAAVLRETVPDLESIG
jgi:L-threonylcarbamoyladenylate synthase